MPAGNPNPVPPFQVRIEERAGYLFVEISGDKADVESGLAIWTEIGEECRRRGLRRVLTETRMQRELSFTEIYDLCRRLPGIPALRGLRIAFLDRRNLDFGMAEFAETVAVNRGMLGRVFSDSGAAEKWLMSDSD